MKKIRNFMLILLSITFLAACSSHSAGSFVSFEDNLLLTYEVDGEDPFTFQIFNSYSSGNRVQRRLMQQGIVGAEVLEVRDGELLVINSSRLFIPHTSIIDVTQGVHDVIISGPIRLGNYWLESPLAGDGTSAIREITGIDMTVITPAGTFETIEITTIHPHDTGFIEPPRLREYFAPGLGVVKQLMYGGIHASAPDEEEDLVTVRLVDIQQVGLTESVDILYSVNDSEFTQMDILHTTNNDLTKIYAPVAHRVLYKSLGYAVNEDVSINFAFVNPSTNALNLDFCANFLTEMARSSDYEQERRILTAIANTFGVIYMANTVRITVDGQTYSGRYVTLGQAESIPVGTGIWQ